MRRSRARPAFCGGTAVVGIGSTPFTRQSGRSVLALATQAATRALDDAGLRHEDVDGIVSYSLGDDSVGAAAVATSLGVPELRHVADLNMGGQAPCLLVAQAAAAVSAGLADTVLVFRALNGRSGQRVGRTRTGGPGAQFRYPVGLTAWPQYQALWAQRFLAETGMGEKDLGAVAVAQRWYAERNDRAVLRRGLDIDGYLASPYVVQPLRVADCTTEVDGACALVVTSLERARTLRRPPVVVAGAAYVAGPRPGLDIGDVFAWPDYSRNFTSHLADRLWASARLGPDDVDVAEIYDCFSHVVLMGLEGLGFVDRGESGAFVADGRTGLSGSLPTNTHGGLLCEGYLHGMNTVVEAVRQLRGGQGERQVPGAEVAAVTSGAVVDGSALVLTRDPGGRQ
ncbi:MAG TPA: lipid-transfer protein [Nocardioidaceae bacterium]|jgi:acetyl-CoA acetyltransferase|nr:lipid-transfer protein [Nocardioidaceae bacterium]HEU5044993.1 lipid-transfer protein [Nocardioidaceae bacterium]